MSDAARMFWLAILTAHATAAGAWWWLMPGGFPVSHPRFWINQVLPWLVIAYCMVVRFVIWRKFPRALPFTLAAFGFSWLALVITALITFPKSAIPWALPGVLPAIVGLGILRDRTTHSRYLAFMLPPIALAIAFVITQRGADPDTRPLNPGLTDSAVSGSAATRTITLADGITLQPGEPVALLQRGRATLAIQPALTFISRSPDRCWTIFSTREERNGPRRELVFLDNTNSTVTLAHRDDMFIHSAFTASPRTLHIDSRARLDRLIYSHLNTFTELTVTGHRKLAVCFSPCPTHRIDFKPFSIRGDSPGQCAYLDADGSFRIVRARRGEKGPFTALAQGRLNRSDPITLTFFDEDRPIFELTMHDWAAQAGTQLSPTAGWGLPVNAIEFRLDGESDRSAAGVWITLAATSVGRGWDSVGHAAGTYRNRIDARILE